MEKEFKKIKASRHLLWRGMGRLYFLKNKYLLAAGFFVIWMLFFDPKDWSNEIRRKVKYDDLQKSEQKLTELIKDTKQELGQLKNNAQTIEKYAREKYLMKKDNEDLFIISSPDANK